VERRARIDRWKRRLLWLTIACIALVTLYGLRNLWLPPLGRWLDVSTAPHKTEYAMVLGGADERRPFVAAALLRRGYADKAIIPKLAPSPDVLAGNTIPTHQRIRRVLLQRGIEESDLVVLDTQIRTTFDEAEALRRFLESRPKAQVAIVTDDYHTRRTRWVFRHSLGDRAKDLYFVTGPVEGIRADNWWQTRKGAKAYISEYLKLTYYWCRYGSGLVWIVGSVLLVALFRFRRLLPVPRRITTGGKI